MEAVRDGAWVLRGLVGTGVVGVGSEREEQTKREMERNE